MARISKDTEAVLTLHEMYGRSPAFEMMNKEPPYPFTGKQGYKWFFRGKEVSTDLYDELLEQGDIDGAHEVRKILEKHMEKRDYFKESLIKQGVSGVFHYTSMPDEDFKKYNTNYKGEQTMGQKTLYVYHIVLVDKKESTIIADKTVIGTEADGGMLEMGLTKEQQKWLRLGRIGIFTQGIGSFEKYKES